jgi:probable HAF family extracellular repeat protein
VNNKRKISAIGVFLLGLMTVPIQLSAQDPEREHHRPKHHTYKMIDLGTFGGPNSNISNPSAKDLNNRGSIQGWADTPVPDPFAPNCFNAPDCFVSHAFERRHGVVTDLGVLPGGGSSAAGWINERGVVVGVSQNGSIDKLTGFPEEAAVVWRRGQIIRLETFGGNQSSAAAISDRGQIVGATLNTIPDPYSSAMTENFVYFAPAATQSRAALWLHGEIHDLGTLGGNDAAAMLINARGQIAGVSYTNTRPNAATGTPTQDPFVWEDGDLRDLGTLGGTSGYPNWMNNRGQVVGQSDLAGDQSAHPFLSNPDRPMKDLGTLGGKNGEAFWVNDAGEVVGQADLPGSGTQLHDAFLWKHGRMIDLGTVAGDPCSRALSINSQGQIAGASTNCTEYLHAFLWEHGAMVDLNMLVHPRSALRVRDGDDINDRGEIAGRAVLPNGDVHAVLLIPDGDCDDELEARITASQKAAAATPQAGSSIGTPASGREAAGAPANSRRNRSGERYTPPRRPSN